MTMGYFFVGLCIAFILLIAFGEMLMDFIGFFLVMIIEIFVFLVRGIVFLVGGIFTLLFALIEMLIMALGPLFLGIGNIFVVLAELGSKATNKAMQKWKEAGVAWHHGLWAILLLSLILILAYVFHTPAPPLR